MWKRNPLKSDEGGQALAANRLIGSWEFCGGTKCQSLHWTLSTGRVEFFQMMNTTLYQVTHFPWRIPVLQLTNCAFSSNSTNWPKMHLLKVKYISRVIRLLGAFGTKESINIKVSSKNVTIAMHCSVLFLSLLWTQAHLLHLLWISTVNKQWLFINLCRKWQPRNSEWLNIILAFGFALNASIYDSEWTLLLRFKPIGRIIQILSQP